MGKLVEGALFGVRAVILDKCRNILIVTKGMVIFCTVA